jgi:hypothetical protein
LISKNFRTFVSNHKDIALRFAYLIQVPGYTLKVTEEKGKSANLGIFHKQENVMCLNVCLISGLCLGINEIF